MSDLEFMNLVKEMRTAQKEFFKDRSTGALSDAKRLEKEVDAEISRRERIEQERLQPSLFDL